MLLIPNPNTFASTLYIYRSLHTILRHMLYKPAATQVACGLCETLAQAMSLSVVKNTTLMQITK